MIRLRQISPRGNGHHAGNIGCRGGRIDNEKRPALLAIRCGIGQYAGIGNAGQDQQIEDVGIFQRI